MSIRLLITIYPKGICSYQWFLKARKILRRHHSTRKITARSSAIQRLTVTSTKEREGRRREGEGKGGRGEGREGGVREDGGRGREGEGREG